MGGKEKEKQVTVSVTLEIVLTQEDIDDIMCGALEGGITYWCDEAKVVGDYLGEYGSEQIARGGKLRLHLPEPFDKDETEYYELDLEKFKKGVELWAITPVGCNCLEQIGGKIRFDTCNADAIVCDAIIQYALFGTVVLVRRRDYGSVSGICVLGNRWSWKQKVGVSGEQRNSDRLSGNLFHLRQAIGSRASFGVRYRWQRTERKGWIESAGMQ